MNRTYEDMSKEELVTLVTRLTKQHDEWREESMRLRKREATFDEFIDSLDVYNNEHEWMLVERIDEIHERLHGGKEE